MPGETGYVIAGEPPSSTGTPGNASTGEKVPWYDALWRSVDAAAKAGGDHRRRQRGHRRDCRAVRREPRGLRAVAHRCECGLDVVETSPRLSDGTPFPTLYYLTRPRATAAVSTLEADGVMRALQDELMHDEELAAAYEAAHRDYLARREAVQHVDEIAERVPRHAEPSEVSARPGCLRAGGRSGRQPPR